VLGAVKPAKSSMEAAEPQTGPITLEEIRAVLDEIEKKDKRGFFEEADKSSIAQKILGMRLKRGSRALVVGPGGVDYLPMVLSKLGIRTAMIDTHSGAMFGQKMIHHRYDMEKAIESFDSYDDIKGRTFDYVFMLAVLHTVVEPTVDNAATEFWMMRNRNINKPDEIRRIELEAENYFTGKIDRMMDPILEALNADGGYLFVNDISPYSAYDSLKDPVSIGFNQRQLQYLDKVLDGAEKRSGIVYSKQPINIDDFSMHAGNETERRRSVVYKTGRKALLDKLTAEAVFAKVYSTSTDYPADAAKIVDQLGMGNKDNVLCVGIGNTPWYPVACAIRGAKVDICQPSDDDFGKDGQNERVKNFIEQKKKRITEVYGTDLIKDRIDTGKYLKRAQDAGLPRRHYSNVFLPNVIDYIKSVDDKKALMKAVLDSLTDEATIIFSALFDADGEMAFIKEYADSLGYDVRPGMKFDNPSTEVAYELKVSRRKSHVLEEIHTLFQAGLQERPANDGSKILLSENLFIKDGDQGDLVQIRIALGSLLQSGAVAIMKPEEIRRSAMNRDVTKENMAIVLTKEDFDNKEIWSGSDKETSLRSSVLILDDKMTGNNYLYLEGVIGLARAVMARNRQAVKEYYRLISGVAIDDQILQLLKDDDQNNIAFAVKAILRFRPISMIVDSEEFNNTRIMMENALIAA
jgi:hypothetical protein